MDYKYIEQLIERYWLCETSLEEEAILRYFFSQKDVPAHLCPYKHLFAAEHNLKNAKLGEDFDKKVLAKIEENTIVKAKKISITRRLMPLYKAAASVAILLTIGNALQNSFLNKTESDYHYESYKDTYSDPQVAYDQMSDALEMVSFGLNETETTDSLNKNISVKQNKQ